MFLSNAAHPVMKADCGQKNIAQEEYNILHKSSRRFFESWYMYTTCVGTRGALCL